MITQLLPAMLTVAEKEVHSPEFATLYVNQAIDFKPGQFVMVWIPGVDEKPYTISHHTPDRFGITVEAKGVFSKKPYPLGLVIKSVSGDLLVMDLIWVLLINGLPLWPAAAVWHPLRPLLRPFRQIPGLKLC
jgi:hypothetical protein